MSRPSSPFRLPLLLLAPSVLQLGQAQVPFERRGGPVIEVDLDGGPHPELLEALGALGDLGGPGGPPGRGFGPGSSHGRENELDQALEGMLGEMLGPGLQAAGRPPRMIRGGRPPFLLGGPPGGPRREEEVLVESSPFMLGGPLGGPHGEEEVLLEGPPFMRGGPFGRGPLGGGPQGLIIEEVEGPGPKSHHIPMETFNGLFPGPLLMEGGPIETPFGAPDPLVMDMLQDIGHAFQEQILPKLAAGPQGRSTAPHTCNNDLKKHCRAARSQLHCLGQHSEDVSEPCRQDVGKSVPFVCSRAIDEFCHVMRSGVLSCLENHMYKLQASCKDAVLATRHIIKKASKGKASFIDLTEAHRGHSKAVASTSTPVHAVHAVHAALPPHASAPPAQKEAALDARLLRATKAEGPMAVEHGSAAPAHGPLLHEANHHAPIVGVLSLVALVVIACISFFSVTTNKSGCTWLLPFGGEGREPLRAGVELPRPAELAA